MAAETALQGHAAPPRQLQEAFQLIFTHRKNASHRRVQGGCGCFNGAARAVGEAEARGGPRTRARWPPRPPEPASQHSRLIPAARLAVTASWGKLRRLLEMACNRYLHNPPQRGNHPDTVQSAGEPSRDFAPYRKGANRHFPRGGRSSRPISARSGVPGMFGGGSGRVSSAGGVGEAPGSVLGRP